LTQVLIYTDLDATLIDAKSGSFEPAKPMINQINQMGIPWMLNSSRTASELLHLRKQMDNRHPFAAEHGGAVCVPKGYYAPDPVPLDHEVKIDYLGLNYKSILYELVEIKDLHDFSFVGMDDISVTDLSKESGLPLEISILAKQRLASEAILWLDDQRSLVHFEELLIERGLRLTKGARFYFITSERSDKGGAITWLNFNFHQHIPDKSPVTIGVGDSLNDLSLLSQVDVPVVVAPPRGSSMQFDHPKVIYTESSGPAGWAEGVSKALQQLSCL